MTKQPADWIELPVEWERIVRVVVLLLRHGGCDEICNTMCESGDQIAVQCVSGDEKKVEVSMSDMIFYIVEP